VFSTIAAFAIQGWTRSDSAGLTAVSNPSYHPALPVPGMQSSAEAENIRPWKNEVQAQIPRRHRTHFTLIPFAFTATDAATVPFEL
jgi:hypothetical protein